MRGWIVLLCCVWASVVQAKGPTTPARVESESAEISARRSANAAGYRIFGGYLGASLGSLATAAAFATGSEAAPAATGLVAVPMSLATMATLASAARNNDWNPRVGNALAGLYPGAAYGALTGFMIAQEAGLEGRLRHGLIIGLGTALAATTMGIWSRLVNGRSLRKAMGMMYVMILAGCLFASPYAVAAEKPRALGWAAVGMGAIALTVASFETTF